MGGLWLCIISHICICIIRQNILYIYIIYNYLIKIHIKFTSLSLAFLSFLSQSRSLSPLFPNLACFFKKFICITYNYLTNIHIQFASFRFSALSCSPLSHSRSPLSSLPNLACHIYNYLTNIHTTSLSLFALSRLSSLPNSLASLLPITCSDEL